MRNISATFYNWDRKNIPHFLLHSNRVHFYNLKHNRSLKGINTSYIYYKHYSMKSVRYIVFKIV